MAKKKTAGKNGIQHTPVTTVKAVENEGKTIAGKGGVVPCAKDTSAKE